MPFTLSGHLWEIKKQFKSFMFHLRADSPVKLLGSHHVFCFHRRFTSTSRPESNRFTLQTSSGTSERISAPDIWNKEYLCVHLKSMSKPFFQIIFGCVSLVFFLHFKMTNCECSEIHELVFRCSCCLASLFPILSPCVNHLVVHSGCAPLSWRSQHLGSIWHIQQGSC